MLTTIATYAAFVIAGIIVALNAIAPLTKTDWDNKILRGLVWIHDVGLKLILPQHEVAVPSAPTADPAK